MKLEVVGAECKRLSEEEVHASIQVRISNAGVSPAIQAGVSVATRVTGGPAEYLPIDLPDTLGQFAPIFPGEPVMHSASYQPRMADIRRMTQAAINAGTDVVAIRFEFKVSYRSAFDDQVHVSAFRYLMLGMQHDVEWLARDREVGEIIVPRIDFRRQVDDVMT